MPCGRSMKRILCQRRVSSLLTVLLLPVSIAPPGLRHTHAGGNRPHRHDLIAEHDHAHDCPDHHATGRGSTRHNHQDQGDSATLRCRMESLLPAVAHVHFSWFGMSTSLPVSSIPQENGQGGDSSARVVVQPFWDFVSLVRPQVCLAICLSIDWDAVSSGPIVCTVTRYAAAPVLSAPLCDNARHERSGVQLI